MGSDSLFKVASGIDFDWDAENTLHLKRHRVAPGEFEELMMIGPERWRAL